MASIFLKRTDNARWVIETLVAGPSKTYSAVDLDEAFALIREIDQSGALDEKYSPAPQRDDAFADYGRHD